MGFRARDLIYPGSVFAAVRNVENRLRRGRMPAVRRAPFPVARDVRVGGDDGADPLRHGLHRARSILRAFTLANPYRVVIDMPQVSAFQLRPKTGENRPRPGRGVPLRPGHAGRLPHRDRPGQAGADREGVRARCPGRPAGAGGARPRGDRPRQLHEDGRGREASRPEPAGPARPRSARRNCVIRAAIRGRSW